MSWTDSLIPTSTLDLKLRMAATLALLLWNFAIATSLETPYPDWLVNMYALPLTRLFLLGLVILSSMWCPSVGIMAAFAYISLGADVLITTKSTSV
jgi:hypothetical protein